MKKKIKISFVGVGFMSQIAHLINYYKNQENVELFEVCDLDIDLAKKIKKKFKFTGKVFSDYKKMSLNRTDGFVIVLQRKLIPNVCDFFIKKKCNIFSEKPHAYSLSEYRRIAKYQSKIWLKGYTRRSDSAVIFLEKNLKSFIKDLGEINSITHYSSAGNSYLGSKHFVNPTIEKKIKSKISSIPGFVKKKDRHLYDIYVNSALHSLDLLDFFNLKYKKILYTKLNDDYFLYLAESKIKIQKKIVLTKIFLNASPNPLWDEETMFHFKNGYIKIKYNSPLFKKTSHILTIYNKKNNSLKKKYFKNSWSFENQSKRFIEMIKNKDFKNKDSISGEEVMKTYESIWKKSYLRLK